MWGLNMETLERIHESCKSQSHLECVEIFTPTRHILQAIRRTWKTDRVHGLPAVVAPTFLPSASKGNDAWWGSQDTKTIYLWDSMDDQDRQNTLENLKITSGWTIWKTRDREWSPVLCESGFHQLLNIHKDKRAEYWGFKIKGWWRKGDIRTTNPRKSFECWVKTTSDVPIGTQKSLTEALTVPQHNVGKDAYIVDLESDEKLY